MRAQKSLVAVEGLPISPQGPIAMRLQRDFAAKRRAISNQLLSRLNARLTDTDRRHLDRALCDLQDEFLRTPLSAIQDEAAEGAAYRLPKR
jgi:hypothetical protein